MSDFSHKVVGQGTGAGVGVCGAAPIPGHHPEALAAPASSAGQADKREPLCEAVIAYWGERCLDHEPACPCCQSWALIDRLNLAPATPEGDVISRGAEEIAVWALDQYEGAIRSDYEGTSAFHPMLAEVSEMRAALRSLPPQDGEREPDWTEAARHMLEVWDSWLGGKAPAKRDDADRLLVAACFAAQQFEDLASSGMTADGAPSGLLRAFLLALIDPALPELDHLRACNRSPAALTAQPVAQEPVAWPGPGRFTDLPAKLRRASAIVASKMVSDGQIQWISDVAYDAALKIEELERGHAQSATPAPVEAGLIEALTPSGDTKAAYMGEFKFPVTSFDEDGEEVTHPVYVPWDTIKEIMAAIRLRAQSAPVGGEGGEG